MIFNTTSECTCIRAKERYRSDNSAYNHRQSDLLFGSVWSISNLGLHIKFTLPCKMNNTVYFGLIKVREHAADFVLVSLKSDAILEEKQYCEFYA